MARAAVERVSPSVWTCPECGRRFARRGQTHVCGSWTVEDHLVAGTERGRALFDRFSELVSACGRFEYSPTKTTVVFRGSRRGFAGARPERDRLVGYLDLPRRVERPPFREPVPYGKRLFVHHFRIESLEELDDDFAELVREAHAVGEGEA